MNNIINHLINFTDNKKKDTYKLNSKIYKKHKSRYIKITRNQIRILESLMNDGGKTKKYYDKNNKLRYSEHSGLLDFGKSTLQRILINATKNLSYDKDDVILLPNNIPDSFDYEYVFHTHPITPTPGSRIKDGFLFEFPSISDVFHFIEHHNFGKIQGSIVIAPEGLYIIKAINPNKIINIKNQDKVYNYLVDKHFEIQEKAIKKYYNKFNIKYFYNTIIKDRKFINMFNQFLKKLNVKIHYKQRIKGDNNLWIIDNFYLKVNPIE